MEKSRILIAEDEKNQRDLLEGFLKKEGFSVDAVSNGREALQTLENNFFDIVLLDYKMPELDGLHTLKEVRQRYPELPVVMMTAYGTVETAVASMKEGALDYLTKPIELRRTPSHPSESDRAFSADSREQGVKGPASGTVCICQHCL